MTPSAAQLSGNPTGARLLNCLGRRPTWMRAGFSTPKYAEDTDAVAYHFSWHQDRIWTYDGRRCTSEGRCVSRLHQARRTSKRSRYSRSRRRASVNEVGGTDVLVPGYLYHCSLDAGQADAALRRGTRWWARAPLRRTLNDPRKLLASEPARRRWTWSRCIKRRQRRIWPRRSGSCLAW